jgi:hypothetical protein
VLDCSPKIQPPKIEEIPARRLYNKTFPSPVILCSDGPKATRWSIKYNKYVYDPISKQQRENEETELPVPIRVMQVQFHQQYVQFRSGLGESIIARQV